MSKHQTSEAFRAYTHKLRSLHRKKEFPMSAEALRALAEEMGVSSEELLQVRQSCGHYLIRGNTYMRLQRWKDAEKEFEDALGIDPFNPNALYQYANLYFIQWKKTGNWEYRILAKKGIAELSRLYPYLPESERLARQFQQLVARKQKLFYLKAAIAIIGIPLLATVAVIFLREAGFMPEVSSGLEGLSYNVPAKFIETPETKGISMKIANFQVQHGETIAQQKHLDYTYTGRIAVSDSLILQRFACNLRFFDDHNNVVAEELDWFLNTSRNIDYPNTFALYSHDQLFFHREHHWGSGRLKRPSRIARVEIEPYQTKILPDTARLIEKPLMVTYPQGDRFPEGLSFGVQLREDSLHLAHADSMGVHYWQMSIAHLGTVPCKEMVMVVSWKDANGVVLREISIPVVHPRNKPLMPGERVALGWQEYFRGAAEKYQHPYQTWSIGCIAFAD